MSGLSEKNRFHTVFVNISENLRIQKEYRRVFNHFYEGGNHEHEEDLRGWNHQEKADRLCEGKVWGVRETDREKVCRIVSGCYLEPVKSSHFGRETVGLLNVIMLLE